MATIRLPSSQNVPSVPVARDPGVNVPFIPSVVGQVAEAAAPVAQRFGEIEQERENRIAQAQVREDTRRNTVHSATSINDYVRAITDEARAFTDAGDFSDKNMGEFGNLASQLRQDRIASHVEQGGSPESLGSLEARLLNEEAKAVGSVSGIVAKASEDNVTESVNRSSARLVESAANNPNISNIIDSFRELDQIIADHAPALSPEREREIYEGKREEIVLGTIEPLLINAQPEAAAALLEGGLYDELSPPERTKLRNRITTMRFNRDQTKVDLSEREKRSIQLQEDHGLSEALANDIAANDVKVVGPDEFGDFLTVNIATGKKTKVTEEDKVVISQTLGLETPAAEPGRSIQEAVEVGTGPFAKAQAGISNIIGPFVKGAVFEETTQSREQIKIFNQIAKTALVNNPRFPVAEQEIVADLLPDPSKFFQDPDTARSNLKQLKSSLEGFKSSKEKELKPTGRKQITSKRKADLSDQISRIDELLSTMEESEQQTVSSQADVDKLAPGTQFIWGPTGQTLRKD